MNKLIFLVTEALLWGFISMFFLSPWEYANPILGWVFSALALRAFVSILFTLYLSMKAELRI